MHAAGIAEPADTYTISDLTLANYEDAIPQNNRIYQSRTMVEYGSVGARHLQQLADMSKLLDTTLQPHVFEVAQATGLLEQDARNKLRELLVQHAMEWHGFIDAQGKRSFMNNWVKGGRYG
jgi:hypothetical protein